MFNFKTFNNIAEDGLDILRRNKIKEVSNNPDGILLRSHALAKEEFEENLLCIARAGAGTNNIPIDDATQKGIVVFNTPGANANAVKELVVCGMLLSSRGIIQGNLYSKTLSGQDTSELNKSMESQKKNFKGNELKGKTLGIIGLGAIGSLLAQTAEVMGMKIIGYDPYISIDAAWRLPKDVEKADSMEYLLNNSDYISIHVPLVDETKDLISKKSLKHFKKGAKLINLSRGGIVNNEDIIEALDAKIIDKFVTDFPTPELVTRSNDFHDVILLPHLGASTKEAEINCAVMAAEQISNFLKDGVIVNSVNFPSIKLGRKTEYRMVIINKNEPIKNGDIGAFLINNSEGTIKFLKNIQGKQYLVPANKNYEKILVNENIQPIGKVVSLIRDM